MFISKFLRSNATKVVSQNTQKEESSARKTAGRIAKAVTGCGVIASIQYAYNRAFPKYQLQSDFYPSVGKPVFEEYPIQLKHYGPFEDSFDVKLAKINEFAEKGSPVHIEVQAYQKGGARHQYWHVRATRGQPYFWPNHVRQLDQCMRAITTSTLHEGVPQCLKDAGFTKISPWFSAIEM